MAIIADFMLVYLSAPAFNAGDNAFQIALGGASYSLTQHAGAIVRNRSKLFAVGTTSSLVGTFITNDVFNARKAVDKQQTRK